MRNHLKPASKLPGLVVASVVVLSVCLALCLVALGAVVLSSPP